MKRSEKKSTKKNTENTRKKRLVLPPGAIVPLWAPIDEDEIPIFDKPKTPDALPRVLDGSLKPSYIARHRFELLREAVTKDRADALPVLMPEGRRLSPDRFEELVTLASDAGSPECAGWLLKYRRSHYSDADFEALEEKRFETELGLAEPGLSDYRKMFRISYVHGGIHIGGPKAKTKEGDFRSQDQTNNQLQNRNQYHIPAAINGKPVVSVDREAFYGLEPNTVISRTWPDEEAGDVKGPDAATLEEAEVGDVIFFGRYSPKKGKEQSIPWRVLAKSDGDLLVISDVYVATLAYHSEPVETSWEVCFLRRWLNEAFLPLSFTPAERRVIKPCEVKAKDSKRFGTEAGNDTTDYLYIPGIDEITELMPSDESRRTGSWWWLRTPGCNSEFAACVKPDGKLTPIGNFADSVYGVRPLMRIKI